MRYITARETLRKTLNRLKYDLETKVDRKELFEDGNQGWHISTRSIGFGLAHPDTLERIQATGRAEGKSKSNIAGIVFRRIRKFFAEESVRYGSKGSRFSGRINFTGASPFTSTDLIMIKNKEGAIRDRIDVLIKELSFGTSDADVITAAFVGTGSTVHNSHLMGGITDKASRVRESIQTLAQQAMSSAGSVETIKGTGTYDLILEGMSIVEETIQIDGKLKHNSKILANNKLTEGTATLWVSILESRKDNSSTGSKARAHLATLNSFVEDIGDSLRYFLLYGKGSPSTLDIIDDNIVAAFMDNKKEKAVVRKGSVKHKEKITKKKKIKKLAIRGRGRASTGANLPDLLSLTRQINAAMHETLKLDVMGKGAATELLNYRTGRFAESVKVRRLVPSQTGKSMSADITYMKNPYMVFSPVGGLHKPLRNPTLLAGRAIRIIMKDLAIQGLSLREVREV